MSIERRLERLERDNRRLRAALGGVVVAAASLLLMGAIDPNLPKTVRATKFELIGGAELDRVIAELTPTPSGAGALITYNTEGGVLAELRPRAGMGSIATYNEAGYPLVALLATPDASGSLQLHNDRGRRLVMMQPTEHATGGIITFNGEGYPMVELGAGPEGKAELITSDGRGHELVRMGASKSGGGVLATYNGSGHRLAELGVKSNGRGRLAAYDGAGAEVAQWPAGDEGGGSSKVWHTVRAQNFEVTNRDGSEVLVRMTRSEDGQGLVITYTADGRDTVKIGTGPKAGEISRYDESGERSHVWPVVAVDEQAAAAPDEEPAPDDEAASDTAPAGAPDAGDRDAAE